MSSDNGTSSSDENLYSRLGKRDETTRRTSLRASERRARSSSRSLLQLDEPSCHGITPASVPAPPFAEILAEIETARFAVAGAIKKVMVGTQAILHPECTEPGAGPPEIDGILESVRALELKMCATSNGDSVFYMRDPPSADEPVRQPAEARLLSFVSKDVLYLFPWKTGGSVGFGIAVSRDDLRAIQISDTGRLSYPFMMSLGVTPFLAMPPDGMLAAARENEQRYRDRAGHGFHLPTFVEAYVNFLAFVVQETPAALGALLLCERHPRAAEELVIEHDKLTAKVSSAALYFLGYEETGYRPNASQRRSLRESEVSRSCGLALIDALVGWKNQCCRSSVLGEFADSYRDLHVDKIADVLVRQRP